MSRRGRLSRGRGRAAGLLYLGALADGSQFGKNQPLVFQADALQVGPQMFLNIDGTTFQAGGEIVVLGVEGVAKAALDEVGAKLGSTLQIRQGAQELDLVILQLAFPLGPPLRPMTAQIGQFVDHSQLPGDLRQRAVVLRQGVDTGVHAGDHFTVEFHLLADVPVECARHQALPTLHQRIDQAAAARVDRADGGHFALRAVAGAHQRHQVGQRDVRRGGFGMARAHPFPHFPQDGDEFSAFHGDGSRQR